MNKNKSVSRITSAAAIALAAFPLLLVSATSNADVIQHLERGETLRNAVSLEARNDDGLTIAEMTQALTKAELFNPSLMLLYAAEEHPTKACRYIESYKQASLRPNVSVATLIALTNNSAAGNTLLRCLAKFQPQLAGEVYVNVLVEVPDYAERVLGIYQQVDPQVALSAYRKGMQILASGAHCPALSQLCNKDSELRFDLAGTPKYGLAGGEAYARYTISTQYSDNVNRSNTAAVAESAVIFSPAFGAKRDFGGFSVVAAADAALAASRETDAQAYADYSGLLGSKYQSKTGVEISFGGAYRQSHDKTGLGRDEGGASILSLDRWERTSAELKFRSKAPNSPISIELSFRGDETEYLNNDAATAFLNRLGREASFNIGYAISELTQLVVGTKQLSVSYREEPKSTRDFDEHTHWAALNTSITGALDLKISGGITDRNIVDVAGEPERRGFWDAALDWTPEQQTRFTLAASSDNSQSFDPGTRYLKNYRGMVAWHNDWLSAGKWSTDISVAMLRSEHIGRATAREDETLSYVIQFNRKIGSSALLSVNLSRDERESNIAINEYLRDTATVALSSSF